MNRSVSLTCVALLACSMCILTSLASKAVADNGTTVSGTVIGIDSVNQVMRVYVTAVNGQSLFGSPQTDYVDYLVTPNTVVLGPNNQFVSQANVLVGSRIQMQFAGPIATTIVLLGSNYNYNTNYNNSNYSTYSSSGFVSLPAPARNYSGIQVQSFRPVHLHVPQIVVPQTQPIITHVHQPVRSYTLRHANSHHVPFDRTPFVHQHSGHTHSGHTQPGHAHTANQGKHGHAK